MLYFEQLCIYVDICLDIEKVKQLIIDNTESFRTKPLSQNI